jgi:DNA polymerase-1
MTTGPSSSKDPRELLLLVDGNNLVYRSFFAIPPLANRSGVPTNAVLGFANVLRKLLADEPPARAAVTFDAGGKTFRHEKFEAYKANRPPTPPDLKCQLPNTRRLCEVLGLPIVEFHGIEADDIIGTLARRGLEAGYRVDIVTSDKDLFQLVGDGVTVVHPVQYERLDAAGVEKKLGVAPEHVVDFLAMKGDSVDNVPGIPGIGDKGAAKLINEYGTLEEILAHADEVRNKRQREALQEHRDQALLSKELVTIDTRLDFELDPDELLYKGADRDAAFALFEELEFTTLIKDYLPVAEPVDLTASFRALGSKSELSSFIRAAAKRGRVSMWFDLTEVKRFAPWDQRLVGVGLAVEPGEGVYAALDEAELLASLKDIVSDGDVVKLGHDLKRAVTFFGARGIRFRRLGFDTRIAAYVLNPSRRSQDLSDLLLEFLQAPLTKVAAEQDDQGVLPGLTPPGAQSADASGPLNAERAERILRLEEKMARRIEDEELGEVFREIEMPLIEVLARMELAGIAIDGDEFIAMAESIGKNIDALTKEIHELAGVEFNINSPRQLGEILFEKMNLPSFKKTQKQRAASTRVEVLEELARSFPFPRKVLDYRSLAKLKGTYVDALPNLVSPETGRIHTTFNQTVAATGRLSSSDPNLQNIPIRTELGRRLRRAFVAESGSLLLSADYSQIELRVLAHLSKDVNLIMAFREGADIHDQTARQVFGDARELDDIERRERRRRAKIINFSIIYGKTAYTLAKDFGIPTREAQAFIDSYFERYPKVRDLLDEIIRDARKTGKVRTLFGRQRYVPEIGSRNHNTRAGAERVAVNTPIQGTAADLIKKAMIDLSRGLEEGSFRSRLLLQVHDELVLEVPEDEVDRASELVQTTMESVYPLDVPLKVDVAVGKSWEH